MVEAGMPVRSRMILAARPVDAKSLNTSSRSFSSSTNELSKVVLPVPAYPFRMNTFLSDSMKSLNWSNALCCELVSVITCLLSVFFCSVSDTVIVFEDSCFMRTV